MKMHVLRLPLLIAGAVSIFAGPAIADVSVSLSSTANLNQLHVGDTVTIDVSLTGLIPGQQLDWAAARVVYPGGLLESGTILPGAALPSPLSDPLDFLTLTDDGVSEATFMTFATDPSSLILVDGTIFSFEVTAKALGSGTFEFDPAFLFVEELIDGVGPTPLNALSGAPLSFAIIPEPCGSSLILSGLASFAWFLKRGRRASAHRYKNRPGIQSEQIS
jgi:hypothetical protein